MCGIFAAVSDKPVVGVLVEGLKRLEYRGYDSAGVALLDAGELRRFCAVGKVAALEGRLNGAAAGGRIGIAHTRWATHGAPSEVNSHPHIAEGVAVVHNGIIENHRELRRQLAEQGCNFRSETDSEVIPWLISRAVAQGDGPALALDALQAEIDGSFAIAVMTEGAEEVVHATRRGNPLVAAIGPGGGYLSSDIAALAGFADEAIVLADGDRVELRRDGIKLFDRDGAPVERPRLAIEDAAQCFDKQDYPHHMLKEIHEQPRIAGAIAAAYDDGGLIGQNLPLDFRRLDRLRLIACGSSYYACLTAKRWFAEIAGISAEVELASEFRYAPLVLDPAREAAILVSQSGETADTLAALERLKALGAPTIGLVNRQGSTLARDADAFLPLLAGAEIGVASTKAYLAQLLVLARLAAHAADQRGHRLAARRLRVALGRAPEAIEACLRDDGAILAAAKLIADATSAIFVGRGALYPTALEGALKLKEISYIHAEGFAAGELKHGPIALIDRDTPVVTLAPSGELFPKLASNAREIAARDGRMIVLGDEEGLADLADISAAAIVMPRCDELIQPIVAAVPLQLLSYHVAALKGYDIDRPRNLAKSVTVE